MVLLHIHQTSFTQDLQDQCNSSVSSLCQLTGKRPLPGRDSINREIPGLVWESLAETGRGTNQSKSRERFPVLFGLNEHDQELQKNG